MKSGSDTFLVLKFYRKKVCYMKSFFKVMFLCVVLLYPKMSAANISIFPTLLEFDTAEKKRMDSVRIINKTNMRQTYRVEVVNFIQNENGGYVEVGKDYLGGGFSKPYITFSPRQFSLEPGEVQTVNVGRKASATLKDGEYVSHLRVREIEVPTAAKKPSSDYGDDVFSIDIRTLYAVTIPVVLTKGEISSAADIGDVKRVGKKSQPAVDISLVRKGEHSSKVNIKILDDAGKVVGFAKDVAIYPPNKKRSVIIALDNDDGKLKTNKLKIIVENARDKKDIKEKMVPF